MTHETTAAHIPVARCLIRERGRNIPYVHAIHAAHAARAKRPAGPMAQALTGTPRARAGQSKPGTGFLRIGTGLKRAPRVGLTIALALASWLVVRPADAAPLVVDDFNAPVPPRTSLLTGLGKDNLIDFDASVLGGVRGVYHHNHTNPLGSPSALTVGSGQLASTVGVQARSEVLVSYGAFTRPTGAPTIGGPLLGLDASAYDHFRWTFSGVSSALNLNVVLYTANPLDPARPLYYSSAGINAAPAAPGESMVVDLPMSLGDPFNFAQVDGIVLVINRANGNTNVAFNLDRFELVSAVPEPGNGAMLLTGLAAMALLVHRRRRG